MTKKLQFHKLPLRPSSTSRRITPTRAIKWPTSWTLKKIFGRCNRFVKSADQYCWSFNCTVTSDQSLKDQLKLSYLVGHRDLSGRPNSPLIGRPTILDMSNILLKNPDNQLICRPLWMPRSLFWSLGAKKTYGRPVEL